MTGESLKIKLIQFKISQSEIARKLKISQQSFNQMLASSDVKTGLIERIAEILSIPVSVLYGEKQDTNSAVASGKGSVAVSGNNNVTGIAAADVAVLKERIAMLEKLIDEKERTIKILMGK